MTLKIVSDETGRTFKLGRRIPVAPAPKLRLKNYLMRSLPTPPAEYSYTEAADACLKQMLGNDALGCCTASAAFHIAGVWLANAGMPMAWDTEKQVIPFYSATSGYVPGNENTDNGANISDVLAYWQNYGLLGDGSHKILGYVGVSSRDAEEIATAIWLMEHINLGISLPDKWVNPVPAASGFTWGIAGKADPENGHDTPAFGYDGEGVKNSTWGMLGTITWAAIAEYASRVDHGEIWTAVSADQIIRASMKAPNGFDAEHLLSDIRFFHG